VTQRRDRIPRQMPRAPRASSFRNLSVTYEGHSEAVETRPPDLSTQGMFINTARELPDGAVLKIQFRLGISNVEIRARAEVRYCLSGVGVGVEFIEISPEAVEAIEDEISRLLGNGSRKLGRSANDAWLGTGTRGRTGTQAFLGLGNFARSRVINTSRSTNKSRVINTAAKAGRGSRSAAHLAFGGNPVRDCRKAIRYDVYVPLQLRFKGVTAPRVFTGQLRDISRLGVYFLSPVSVEPDAALELTFALPTDSERGVSAVVRASARALRVDSIEGEAAPLFGVAATIDHIAFVRPMVAASAVSAA
jgi:PilZ domain-containing protein